MATDEVLSQRGTLHKVIELEGGRMTFEADNLDQSTVRRVFDVSEIKRRCKRCFKGE